jgi:hypothetical protein
MHLLLYFSTEYRDSKLNIVILITNIQLTFEIEAWLNFLYIHKLKIVCSVGHQMDIFLKAYKIK